MKKVIDGKIYNTETAESIGYHSEGGYGDFRAFEETLYRTKKGRFFLAGNGGPMTKYAKKESSNTWTGSSDIFVLSEEDAREWAEKYMKTEAYLRYFPAEEA